MLPRTVPVQRRRRRRRTCSCSSGAYVNGGGGRALVSVLGEAAAKSRPPLDYYASRASVSVSVSAAALAAAAAADTFRRPHSRPERSLVLPSIDPPGGRLCGTLPRNRRTDPPPPLPPCHPRPPPLPLRLAGSGRGVLCDDLVDEVDVKEESGGEELDDCEESKQLSVIVQPHDQDDSRDCDSRLLSPGKISPSSVSGISVSVAGMIDAGDFRALQPEPTYQTLTSVNGRMSPPGFSPGSSYATLTPLQPLPPISTVSDKFAYGHAAGNVSGSFTVMQNNGLGGLGMSVVNSPYGYDKLPAMGMSPPHHYSPNNLSSMGLHSQQHSPLSPQSTYSQNGLNSPPKSMSPNGYDSPYGGQRSDLVVRGGGGGGGQSPALSPPSGSSLHSPPPSQGPPGGSSSVGLVAAAAFSTSGTMPVTAALNGLTTITPHPQQTVVNSTVVVSPHHHQSSPPALVQREAVVVTTPSPPKQQQQQQSQVQVVQIHQSHHQQHQQSQQQSGQSNNLQNHQQQQQQQQSTISLKAVTQSSCPSVGGGAGGGNELEEINTKELAQRISAELKRYSIPQAIFAQRVLCRSQGTLSDLLRNPKPWSKLKSGRETFRRMWKWLQEPEFQRMSALRLAEFPPTRI
ncbi:unnamed protein product [Nesidiocoris tenuis]|uniref:CUT domain-containing protein n=1 Tax=Nesidiocoris tenuis TaxID=355587 RepID=A0A6H5GE23_9HEMI|nr:unnamed protein product [Nesidiocoris tenuis]